MSVGACGQQPSDKIHGWPPPESTPVALPDTVEAKIEPDTVVSEADTAEGLASDALVLPDDPCQALIVLACDFFGEYTDNCGEARTKIPDGSDPRTRAACTELVKRFLGEEQESRVNPCRRYARRVCRAEGQRSRACRRARGHVSRLLGARKRLCYGDLLLWEARDLRR